ncbi:Peptidoglycan O-acetyltransferase [Emticicia aquatica]|uniref:Peptidoglycan O-acetyltransferase n=1 Tax=Emticicia aquatica TaxID=1681835 RepID=A0ABM9APG3_9BACT|nr:MBOAT family O-acyltransferase [Emticicia aquatica]CAH0995617.1 Peptidoglycan O-acetyltransferase [Emticicia aquatica]
MLFNSLQFIFFFIVVTLAYFSLPHRGRVWLLLLASCYFYAVFQPIYILILFVTIVVDYFAGIWIAEASGNKRKWLLIISLISNIGFLAYFKYYNFFIENINNVYFRLGSETHLELLKILLPIGLSFHTFQAMSYTIEVYRGNQKAEKDFSIYALYVMFYPQLVAGPIERPQNLLWQFHSSFKYDFENLKEGLMRMAWGMFKKVVIADRLSMVVDYCYDNPQNHNGLTLLVATLFFTFQIYCDFSGYSDIAIGAARVMGFKLMENFDAPYFSKSISEFWRRWHISLSGWFRDYLYIPLGGNRVGEFRRYFNVFFVFMMSGFWHGAAWTFIIWGALHGIYLVLAQIRDKYFKFSFNKVFSENLINGFNLVFTFVLVMFTWVFFRAKGFTNSMIIFQKIFNFSNYDSIATPLNTNEMIFCWVLILILLLKDKLMMKISTQKTPQFYLKFVGLLLLCYFLGVFSSNQFIYFQF